MRSALCIGISVGAAVLSLASWAIAANPPIQVTSPAFTNNGSIPSDYTCNGKSVSPPIEWSNLPPDTKSVLVIVDDPDAPMGVFEHFVQFNIPPSTRSLPSLVQGAQSVAGMQALNSRGQVGFAPICPPGGVHHYRFQVLALDRMLSLPAGANARDVGNAAQGHILARGELVGTYGH
jgi:Raf kinase inhibitor-like YbhB/YbcL family protein